MSQRCRQETRQRWRRFASVCPILDTREYEVQLPDGSVECSTDNSIPDSIYVHCDDRSGRMLYDNGIPDNIFVQCDGKGNYYTLLEEIVDHRKKEQL